MFLAAQVAYFLYLFSYGISAIQGLVTLGTQKQTTVYDESLGFAVTLRGDNSMLLLIGGVFAIIVTILFLCVYYINIKSVLRLQRICESGQSVPGFYKELYSFLDSRFHITLMTLPVAGIIIFTALPLIFMVLIAFTNYDYAHTPPGKLFDWVGFANFKTLFSLSGESFARICKKCFLSKGET